MTLLQRYYVENWPGIKEYLSRERVKFFNDIENDVDYHDQDRVLDAGCGHGYLLASINQREVKTVLYGCDISKNSEEQVRKFIPSAKFSLCSLYDMPYEDDFFDLVFCTEVIEHLSSPCEAISELFRVLAPKGRLIVTIPEGRQDTSKEHINFWTKESFTMFLRTVLVFKMFTFTARALNNDKNILYKIIKESEAR